MVPKGIKVQESLAKHLSLIEGKCQAATKETTQEAQQNSINDIESEKVKFKQSLDTLKAQNLIDGEEYLTQLELLLETTYRFDKLASRQGFGWVKQPPTMSGDFVIEKNLSREESKDVVKSANETQKARLKKDGKLVFCKNTKPEVAQLEVVAAEFFRHIVGGSCTAHGKLIQGEDNKISGMYVEAIPGFISMRQLTDLAKGKDPYYEISQKIIQLKKDINIIENELKKSPDKNELQAQLQEKKNFLDSWTQIRDKGLINAATHSVNIDRIPGMVAKALSSAFYFQDWDRHKDNFGISCSGSTLNVASLDYDKSLSGIFHQDHKAYNWTITPGLLKDFPNFKCWYWPTSNEKTRKALASAFTPEKAPKMYGESEANQYSQLKDNPEFQRQARIEWLKLIFIPKELRQLSVAKLASPDCDQRLKDTPEFLEKRRQELLHAAIQLNSFRDAFRKDPTILKEVKDELNKNLSQEEFKIVERNWNRIQNEVDIAAKRIEVLEQIVQKKYPKLLAAIKETGISFSPSLTVKHFREILDQIKPGQSSQDICDMLNEEFGLHISEQHARAIKEEAMVEKPIMSPRPRPVVPIKTPVPKKQEEDKRLSWQQRYTKPLPKPPPSPIPTKLATRPKPTVLSPTPPKLPARLKPLLRVPGK